MNYKEEDVTDREENCYAESTSQFDHIAEKMWSEGLSEDKISTLQMSVDELAKEDLQKPFYLRNVDIFINIIT